jgi:tetratricopeptide (TPR) repeat protein
MGILDIEPVAQESEEQASTQSPNTGGSPSKELDAALSEVNKLIFVQDFDAAQEKLETLSQIHPCDCEVQFRYVEVSWKTGSLEETSTTLRERAELDKENIALQLAWTLSEIRLLEQKSSEADENMELMNTTGQRMDQADVFALSSRSELNHVPRYLPQTASSLELPTHQSKGFRLMRNPQFADDAVPHDLPTHEEAWADSTQGTRPGMGHREHDLPTCIKRAHQYSTRYPQNYATWFVHGCALEYTGNLNEAVVSWTRAAQLEPKSISVLATMAELQQMGVISSVEVDYSHLFEAIDKHLVHGSLETHVALFKEYLFRKEQDHAIAALRTLADWMQRLRGEVPAEIETLCLLGAMKAYQDGHNDAAAEACQREAESIAMAARSSPRSAAQMKFIGEVCQQFGLDVLARQCYVTALSMPDASVDMVVQTTSHCVAIGCTESVRDALKEAYTRLHGASEIRFCMVLASVALAGLSVREYTDRKNLIRKHLQTGNVNAVFPLLQESLQEIDDDAEVHYYTAELLSRFGADLQAAAHFQKMFQIDPYNIDSVVRYCYFLLKIGDYNRVREMAERTLQLNWLEDNHRAELHWSRSTAHFALAQHDPAITDVESALRINPWNGAYITLAMRLQKPGREFLLPEFENVAREFEDAFVANTAKEDYGEKIARWLDHGQQALTAGYATYAYLMARCLFLLAHTNEQVQGFFARAAAGTNSRTAVQHVLLLLQLKPELNLNLARLAAYAAQIYSFDGKWDLCEEWCDISQKSGLEDNYLRAKLLELEAFGLTLQGKNLKRAQGLVEAAIDVFESEKRPSSDAHVLLAFLHVAQGNRRSGLERLEAVAREEISIMKAYLLIKIWSRIDGPQDRINALVTYLFRQTPTTILERQLIEEIFCLFGKKAPNHSVMLAS